MWNECTSYVSFDAQVADGTKGQLSFDWAWKVRNTCLQFVGSLHFQPFSPLLTSFPTDLCW